MTPEQAADKAAEILGVAIKNAHEPAFSAAMVAVADGWTRLHTAIKTNTICEPIEIASLPAAILPPDITSPDSVVRLYGELFRIIGWDFERNDMGGPSPITLKVIPAS